MTSPLWSPSRLSPWTPFCFLYICHPWVIYFTVLKEFLTIAIVAFRSSNLNSFSYLSSCFYAITNWKCLNFLELNSDKTEAFVLYKESWCYFWLLSAFWNWKFECALQFSPVLTRHILVFCICQSSLGCLQLVQDAASRLPTETSQ